MSQRFRIKRLRNPSLLQRARTTSPPQRSRARYKQDSEENHLLSPQGLVNSRTVTEPGVYLLPTIKMLDR